MGTLARAQRCSSIGLAGSPDEAHAAEVRVVASATELRVVCACAPHLLGPCSRRVTHAGFGGIEAFTAAPPRPRYCPGCSARARDPAELVAVVEERLG